MHLNPLLRPAAPPAHRFARAGVLLLLVISATSIFAAPLALPESYSWRTNSISESAAQGLHTAWVARVGFVSFGLAVLWLAVVLRLSWARGAYGSHLAFGVFMVCTAAFSNRPWLEGVPVDSIEDALHSATATGMGFAFSFGVLFRLLQVNGAEGRTRAIDVLALVAATTIPLSMGIWPTYAGVAQRGMFLVAYCWYGAEAWAARR